jgi:hypothetical protein
MRPGVIVSIIGHIGAVLMTLLAWEARSSLPAEIGAVVPIEIVDVALESNVRALTEDVPDEEVSPEETPPTEAEEQPAPAPTPTPQPRRNRNDDFDLSAIAGMIDKQRDPGRRRNEGETSDRSQQGAGQGTAEVASLRDRVRAVGRAHLRRCWRMPVDLPDPERLIVTVEFDINRNGTLNGQPRVTNPRNYTFDPYMRAAAENALRAVRACDPFPFADDPVLGDHYELWRETEVVFDPSQF